MPAINAITPDKLARLIGTPACPALIDLRASGDFIPGAVRRDPDRVADWAGEIAAPSVIVICHQGGSASAAAAAWLRHEGIRAELLEGGVEAWVAEGLPLVREAALPPRDAQGRTRWVTRARPGFLYVMYALLLCAIPLGLIGAVRPEMAQAIAASMNAYLAGIPEPLYALFGTGYLGYTAARQWGKIKGVDK